MSSRIDQHEDSLWISEEPEETHVNRPPDKDDESHERTDEEILESRIRVFQKRQRFMLGLAVFVIIAAFSMRTLDSGKVQIRWLPQLPIPELCGSRALFGTSCPGCGLTRSFIALADGDIKSSIQLNRIGWFLALTLIAQIPYRIYMMRKPPLSVIDLRWPRWFATFLIALLIGNWLTNFMF